MKVLIVEDEALLAMSYKMALDTGGCEVVGIAASADEAVELASERKPEVVLMDIKLDGGTDGIEAATRIQTTLGIPVIFVTGNTDAETKRRALSTCPKAYIEKPVDYEDLSEYLCS